MAISMELFLLELKREEGEFMKSTISYTINGKVSTEETDWLNWVDDAYRICDMLNITPNECDIGSEKGNNIRSVKNLDSKISRLYKNGDSVNAISLFFLPDDYKTIIFDFIVTIARVAEPKEYITVVLHRKYQDQYNSSFDEKKLMTILKDNIVEGEGEVYEMSIEECPEMYAGKANPREFYKTLHTIKTF